MTVVSNSTPLIYLAALSDFDLLRRLFLEIVVPPAVHREVVGEGASRPGATAVSAAMGRWISVRQPTAALAVPTATLHAGEVEPVSLAWETRAMAVLIDDRRAVRWARHLGLRAIPTPAIYTEAKRRGYIGSIREKLDQLRRSGFWLKDANFEAILRDVGEV